MFSDRTFTQPLKPSNYKTFDYHQTLIDSNTICLFSENGDIIVTLLPVNEKLPWISPAKFRPELVPEELMAPVLTVRNKHIYIHFYSNYICLIRSTKR